MIQNSVKETKRRKLNTEFDSAPSIHHKYNYDISKKYIAGKKVLDIGCWSGQFEKLAVDSAKSIVGIDPGEKAIRYAKKQVPKATFLVGNALRLNFASNTFDTVIFIEVIEHLPLGKEKKALAEIARVLKPKGTLILSTPNKNIISILMDPAYFIINHRHYSIKEVTQMLNSTGFNVLSTSKTGGLFSLTTILASTLVKHIFKTKIKIPSWIETKVESEYEKGGFATIHIIARKK